MCYTKCVFFFLQVVFRKEGAEEVGEGSEGVEDLEEDSVEEGVVVSD